MTSVVLGGVPAVLLVVVLGPPAPSWPGFLVWWLALMTIGRTATALLYCLIQAFRARR